MRLLFIMAIAMVSLTACNKVEEEIPPIPSSGGSGGSDSGNYADSIARVSTVNLLQKHTTGNGFHVIIMADGYTKSDISNGTYRKAVQKAADAFFGKEPMASLRDYIDIIEVEVPSNEQGVSKTKHDTALRTYFPDNTSNVYGDSIAIQTCALRALTMVYNIQTTDELKAKFSNTLVITLLNSSTYKGVTLLSMDETVTDRIPSGFSLSYVPVTPIRPFGNINIDIMPYLIRHEGVGHGIGKLGDEYSYAGSVPTDENRKLVEDGLKYGFYMNTKYDASANTPNAIQPIEQTSWLYELAQNANYAGLDINWYTGAFEYPIKFCRCSYYSIMNETYKPGNTANNPNNNAFNTAGRAMIYKRIMKAADPSYTWDLDEFIAFDAKGRAEEAATLEESSSARGTVPYAAPAMPAEQPLLPPRIVQFGL